MGWFTSEYKEDALKWRAQEKAKFEKELEREFAMTVYFHLDTGEMREVEFQRQSVERNHGFLSPHWVVVPGSNLLDGVYKKVCEKAATVGFEIDGDFIPHSKIKMITKGEIKEVTA